MNIRPARRALNTATKAAAKGQDKIASRYFMLAAKLQTSTVPYDLWMPESIPLFSR